MLFTKELIKERIGFNLTRESRRSCLWVPGSVQLQLCGKVVELFPSELSAYRTKITDIIVFFVVNL